MRGKLDAVIEALAAGLMAAMCLIVFLGVFFRYVLVDPLSWAEEIARLCLVWITFLGTYLAFRRNVHIAVDLFKKYFSDRMQRFIHLFVLVVVAAFMGMLIVQGQHYSRAFLGSATPLLGVPLGLVYAALPVSAALLLATILIDLFQLVRRRESPAEEEKGDVI